MTERPSHRLQGTYLEFALRRLLRDRLVAANMGVYWVPGEMEYPYVGPDVLIAQSWSKREDPSVYLIYEDGPLTLVIEIASPATRKMDRLKRDNIYAAELQVPWYLWIDLPRHVLELDRLAEGRYEPVEPNAEGQVWCPELEVGFVWQEDGRLVRVIAPDGTVMLTAEEEAALREEAEARAVTAERRAEALTAELEHLRQQLAEGRAEPNDPASE